MKHVIAMDLGGTKILAALVSEKKKIVKQLKQNTKLDGGWPVLQKQVVDICNELMAEAKKKKIKVSGIGIGSAGPLHARLGLLLDPTNFGWSDKKIHFVRDLKKKIKLPIYFDNDAVAAVLGERWTKAASANSICVTLGTGLGVGILVDDQVIRGRTGLHSEAGHFILRPKDTLSHCECGAAGCAEGFLSGVNFTKWVSKSTGKNFKDAKELTALARAGDAEAVSYFNEYAELMAQYVCSLVVLFYPREIIFSGSFAEAQDLFLPKTNELVAAALARREKSEKTIPKIKISKLHNDNGILGAAFMAFSKGKF
ncbi:MAG: ROK family protein [Pseudobdellovibrio sp.]